MTDATSTPSFSRLRQMAGGNSFRGRKKFAKKPPQNVAQHRRKFPRSQYYFTKGHEHMGEARNVNEEQSPFNYPACSLMFSYFQHWKTCNRKLAQERRVASYKEQHNYNTMQARDILQRLRVDVDIEAIEAKKHKDPDEAIAMTDVDPGYFTELSGRVVKEKFSLQQYVDDIREVFRLRLLAGQETDDCIRIEQQFSEEQRRLDKIKRRYYRYVSGFEEFLSKDHERSMLILDRADLEVRRTAEITELRNQLAKDFGQVRLEVYFWEENWRIVKMCQRFLYQVSPVSWRMEHDWIHRSQSGESVVSKGSNELFGRYRMAEEAASLDTMIELFQQDIADAGPVDLYFEDPFDLIRVFRAIETQNLNALIHLESLAVPMSEMALTIVTAEKQIKTEVTELSDAIDTLEDSIRQTEERAANLEDYANELLQGVFRDLVCSPEVLCLQVYIEEVYETCVGPNDADLDSFSMMKWIEKTHEELNLQLDTLPRHVVLACEKEGFREEIKAMRETEEAAKKFELMHRLLAGLQRLLEPPGPRHRQLMRRSPPPRRRNKVLSTAAEPTEEEKLYLDFFTDFCRRYDFTEYLDKFPDDFDLSFEPKRRAVVDDDDEDREYHLGVSDSSED